MWKIKGKLAESLVEMQCLKAAGNAVIYLLRSCMFTLLIKIHIELLMDYILTI